MYIIKHTKVLNGNIPQINNDLQSSEYKINLADGNTYEIIKERQGYIIKRTINESETEYIDNIKGRKYYSSYSQALKRFNLMIKEINTNFENTIYLEWSGGHYEPVRNL
jgi:YHS domain-containing protein